MNKLMSLALLLALVLGCRTISTLTGNDNLKKVGELWSDVPRMDGLVSIEADMPMFVKIVMRTALNNLYRLNSNNEDKTPATGDWAVFSTTKTTDDVKSFYTNERMTTFGNWEANKNSTCLDGKQQGFSGVMCVFGKNVNNKFIGLLIIATPDEKKKDTNIFFVRVEKDEPSGGNKQPRTSNTPRAAIKPLSGSAPYGIEKRAMPIGTDLDALLPKEVGPYTRALLERSDQRGVTPTSIEVDGNSVYATYNSGSKEVFVEFALGSTAHNAQSTLDNAANETAGTFPTDPRVGSIGTEPSYFKSNDGSAAFYAWTRGNYYFSASAKGGEGDLDVFMQSFPY